jgi:hypothetical protein
LLIALAILFSTAALASDHYAIGQHADSHHSSGGHSGGHRK